MTDHAEPWDDQGHHSNIYDANGDCIATVFNHRAHIIKCVNRCYGINPDVIPELLIAIEYVLNINWQLHGNQATTHQNNLKNLGVLFDKAYEEKPWTSQSSL